MKKLLSNILTICVIILLICLLNKCKNEPSHEKDPSISFDTQTTSPNYLTNDFEDYYNDPTVPVFDDIVELRDYLNTQKDADILEFSFRYTGYDELSARMMAQMCNACYISYNCKGDKYNIVITEYPGDRIVDAWSSGDTSSLTAGELQALNMAVSMVEQAKIQAYDEFDLELQIHDMLANHISYYDDDREFDDPLNPPRHLTVIGALLDGSANCQGYTDAFYTLASIAGFKVGRMSVESYDDLHMTNTICLNGRWYVLDVTYDDRDSKGPTNYRLFNAGRDMITEYSWPEYKACYPIVQYSDNYYYYIHNGTLYYDLQSMADSIAWQWSQNGYKTITSMVLFNNDPSQFKNILHSSLMNTGRAFSYHFSSFYNDRDTFYTIIFD